MLRFCLTISSAPLATYLHTNCAMMIPLSDHSELTRALLCSSPSEQSHELTNKLSEIGLSHWFLAAGLHLLTVEWLLRHTWVKSVAPIRIFILLLFVWANQTPVAMIRAFITIMLEMMNAGLRLSLTRLQVITAAGCTALGLCQSSLEVSSLACSWAAALLITVVIGQAQGRRHAKQILIPIVLYVGFQLFQTATQTLHYNTLAPPLALALQIIVGPILSFVFFPVILISNLFGLLCPMGRFISSSAWSLFEFAIEQFSKLPTGPRFEVAPLGCNALLAVFAMTIVALSLESKRLKSHSQIAHQFKLARKLDET